MNQRNAALAVVSLAWLALAGCGALGGRGASSEAHSGPRSETICPSVGQAPSDFLGSGSVREMLEPVGALLPRTRKERHLFAALAVTAGICEEVLFRGFLLFYLQEVFPGLRVVGAVVVSSVVFGLCHLYQGVRGILGTGAFGAGMAILYVASGSLIVPIILYALLDLRVLLLHRPAAGEDGA